MAATAAERSTRSRAVAPVRAGGPAAWIGILLVLIGLVWLMLRERYFRGWVDDDAYISFRYARNLATGHGLVFNPGERVEGYTNFLWTVLLALVHALGGDLPRAAPLVGGFFAVATVGVVALCARNLIAPTLALRPLVVAVAPVVLCFSDSWAAWGVGGLENALSGFLLASVYYAYLRARQEPARPRLVAVAALAALAVLNHPSNALFAAIFAAHLAWPAGGRVARRDLAVAAATFLVPVVVWTLWRLAYYGDLLPNTFYAKVGFTRFVLLRGLSFLGEVLRALPLAYTATVALALLLARRREWRHPAWIAVTAILLATAYAGAVGGEQFPAFRSLVVLMPFFALVLAVLAAEVGVALAALRPAAGAAAAAGVAAVAVIGHALPLAASPRVRILDEALRLGRTALSTTAALRLKESLPPETLFAHSGAGLIAYYTNFRWIDTLGLTDRHIARTRVVEMGRGAAGHEKGDGQYVWSRRPDYVMFPGYPISDPKPGTKSDRELFAIPEFRSTYRLIRFPFRFQGPHDDLAREYALFLWQRHDHAAPD